MIEDFKNSINYFCVQNQFTYQISIPKTNQQLENIQEQIPKSNHNKIINPLHFQKRLQSNLMEFTQIQQISSFSLPLHKSLTPSLPSHQTFSLQSSQNQDQIFDEPFFHQVMKNLDQLTTTQLNQSQESLTKSNHSQELQDKNIRSTNSTEPKDHQNQEQYKKYDRSKSTIFNNSLTTNRSIRSPTIAQNLIKVFYFNSPIMKIIPYSKTLTIKQLIQRSLDTYLMENNDTIRATQPVERFEMRLPISENDFSPDMSIEPIHVDRVLSENMFETLVLCEKVKKETGLESKPTKEYSFDESSMEYSTDSKVGLGSDETYYELMRMELDKEGNLTKLFRLIKENNLNNSKEFVIKDDIESEFDLSPDHEVKQIQKNRLYLMTKKYLDEAEDQLPGPIRLKTLIHQEVNYLPPIGINEASRYEQFEVTKISSVGIAIDRILGIDQTKIYNYQKQLRQQKRQASMMDKFLGLNNLTGTKRPFRFIREIKEITRFPGGIEVVYPDKTTTFIIKNEAVLQKIYRKLSFLLDLNKISDSKQKLILGEGSSPKKTSSFFKF